MHLRKTILLGPMVALLAVYPAAAPAQPASPTVAEDLLGFIPGETLVAATVEVSLLSDAFAGTLDSFVGTDGLLLSTVNEVLQSRLGVTVAAQGLGIAAWGRHAESWAFLIAGPVTGTPTAATAMTYREHAVYDVGEIDRVDILAFVTPQGLVLGSRGGVTGVLDTAFGGTVPLSAMPWIVTGMTHVAPRSGFFVINGDEIVTGEVLEDWDSGIAGDALIFGLDSTRTAAAVVLRDDANAAAFVQRLNETIGTFPAGLEAMLDDGLSDLEDTWPLGFVHGLAQGFLARSPAAAQDGRTVYAEVSGSPATLFFETMSVLVTGYYAWRAERERQRTTPGWEPSQQLPRLAEAAVSYYDTEQWNWESGNLLPAQFPDPAPLAPNPVRCELDYGSYMDWDNPSWQAMYFDMWDQHIYSYQFDSSGKQTDATFTASAYGDLDCDGELSVFTITGHVDATGTVVLSDITSTNEAE